MHYAKAIPLVGAVSFLACTTNVSVEPAPPTEAPWSVIYVDAVDGSTASMPGKLGGQCLRAALAVDADGASRCVVISATADASGPNHCAAPGRVAVPSQDKAALSAVLADQYWRASIANLAGQEVNNFCELEQFPGLSNDPTSLRYQCQNSVSPSTAPQNGWCYIDPSANPPLGSAQIAASCPPDSQGRILRFTGVPSPEVAGTEALFIVCPPA
jgi:hypothetical protein